jgi:hypothetical protein
LNINNLQFIIFLTSFIYLLNSSVLHAQITEDHSSEQVFDAVYSQCQTLAQTSDASWENLNIVGPGGAVGLYFESRGLNYNPENWKIIIVREPRHGSLKPLKDSIGASIYKPNPDYYGPDQMTHILEAEGKRFKVIESVYVSKGIPEKGHPGCENSFGIEEIKANK